MIKTPTTPVGARCAFAALLGVAAAIRILFTDATTFNDPADEAVSRWRSVGMRPSS